MNKTNSDDYQEKKSHVEDESGYIIELGKVIGEGGLGKVYLS